VIEHSKKVLTLIDSDSYCGPFHNNIPEVGQFKPRAVARTVGQFEIDMSELRLLISEWKLGQCSLVCGTDGGLKESIGTSGYVVYREGSSSPVIKGHSAETQVHQNPSSTRQELRAQLSVEYWLSHLMEIYGEPDTNVSVRIVTDSQASTVILENLQRTVGLKDVLRADADVALAILHCRRERNCITYLRTKVQSHIPLEAAPDEQDWIVNHEADLLATEARTKVHEEEMIAHPPGFLSGSGAMPVVGGVPVTTRLSSNLNEYLYGQVLQDYLSLKYGWRKNTFDFIHWKSHEAAINRFSILQRITVFKLIHGWLATRKHRMRAGKTRSPLCPLCMGIEDKQHIYVCPDARMSHKRVVEFNKVAMMLRSSIDTDPFKAIMAGMWSLTSPETSAIYRTEFSTSEDTESAMMQQESIGWDHFLLGRISGKWLDIGFRDTYKKTPETWAQDLIYQLLRTGVDLWKYRNQLLHGNDNEISLVQASTTQRLVDHLYTTLQQMENRDSQWLFTRPDESSTIALYSQQIAWLDGIKRLFPVKYRETVDYLTTEDVLTSELEYVKNQRSGIGHL